MPQEYALFPTCSVAGNIGFGLGDLSADERRRRVTEVTALVQLQGLEQLMPRQLSGGQQQRVALARAIARHPQLLLLDEPLSALDVPTRMRLRGELRHLLKELAIPSVVVTHDWAEALALGDRMAVVSQGRVLQIGTPSEIFNRPHDAEVARVVGIETALAGQIVESCGELATVDVQGVRLHALAVEGIGPDVFVCIRGEDIVLERGEAGATSARNRLRGRVTEVAALGALTRIGLDCGFPLSAVVTRAAVDDLQLGPGVSIAASIKAGAVHLVPRRDAAMTA
jgi:molybdate transport system ATP-binding protein